jgi:WS/DGAT/MGAT family acyltransferase
LNVDEDERMGAFDAVMWGIERDPLLRSPIVAMVTLDSDPDFEKLKDRIDRISRVVPRMRHRVVAGTYSVVTPRWEVDPNFDLDFHVRKVSVAGHGKGLRPALVVAEALAARDFDRYRPLWEFVLITGIDDTPEEGAEPVVDPNHAGPVAAALIVKLHHSVTDGVGGMQIAGALFDLDAEGESEEDLGPMPPEPDGKVLNRIERLVNGVQHEASYQLDQAGRIASKAQAMAISTVKNPIAAATGAAAFVGSALTLMVPASVPKSTVTSGRSLASRFETLRYPIADLKAVSRASGTSLNSVFMAAVAGGLGAYHRRHGAPTPELRVNMPINLRNPNDSAMGGNRWVPARFLMPTDIADPAARLAAVHKVVTNMRDQPALPLVEPVTRALTRLPAPLTTIAAGGMMKGMDVAATNVPGAPFDVYIAGGKALDTFVFAPKSGAPVNVGLLSYGDHVDIGINLDTRAIPDADVFVECLDAAFKETFALAKKD